MNCVGMSVCQWRLRALLSVYIRLWAVHREAWQEEVMSYAAELLQLTQYVSILSDISKGESGNV
jgi:hypothetical protein